MTHGRLSPKTIVIIIDFIALLAVSPFISNRSPLAGVTAGQSATSLYASISGWNSSQSSGPNPTLTISQGDSVLFTLISADSSTHLFLVDVDKDGAPAGCLGPDRCSGTINQGQTVQFTLGANFAPGSYTYYCFYHPTSMVGQLNVKAIPNFSLSLNPSSMVLSPGGSATSTITMTSQAGFTGNVSLSVLPNLSLTSSLSESMIALPPNGTAGSVLTVTAVSSGSGLKSTSAGAYSLNVTASSGSIFHSVMLQVTVNSESFIDGISQTTFFEIVAAVATTAAVVLVVLYVSRRRKSM
jgi:plastocyanin